MQQMDYSTEEAANEFTIAVFNPSGDTMVAGRQDALHAFHFNAKQGVWEEAGGKQVRPWWTSDIAKGTVDFVSTERLGHGAYKQAGWTAPCRWTFLHRLPMLSCEPKPPM